MRRCHLLRGEDLPAPSLSNLGARTTTAALFHEIQSACDPASSTTHLISWAVGLQIVKSDFRPSRAVKQPLEPAAVGTSKHSFCGTNERETLLEVEMVVQARQFVSFILFCLLLRFYTLLGRAFHASRQQ